MGIPEIIKQLQNELNLQGAHLTVDGVFGPATSAALKLALMPKSIPIPVEGVIGDETPWMDWMKPHIGEKEIYGSNDNPFIMDLYPDGNYPKQHDEIPWCACLANAALKRTGYKGTNSAAAASFDHYGIKCEPKYGAVVTLRHKSGGRHVTFYVGRTSKGDMICLGGNQGNALKESIFPSSELVWCGWPVKA